jgi:hypothetical protein
MRLKKGPNHPWLEKLDVKKLNYGAWLHTILLTVATRNSADGTRLKENNMTDLLSTKIPPRNAKRESLMQLRTFHLDSIRSMAMGKSTIPELQECLTKKLPAICLEASS